MTTSQHIQTSAALDERTPTRRDGLLRDLAVALLMIALALGVAYGASWLLPLEFVVPRPR